VFRENITANVVVTETRRSTAVVNGESGDESTYEYDSIGKKVVEYFVETIEYKANIPISVEVNGSPAGVMLCVTFAVANYEPIISTPDGSTVQAGNDANIDFDQLHAALKLVFTYKHKMKNLISLRILYKRLKLIFKSVG